MTQPSQTPDPRQLALCAHDLRGALTVISGYTSLLSRDDLADEDRRAAVRGIDAAIARADAIIARTLAGELSECTGECLIAVADLAHRATEDARAAYGRDVTLAADPTARVRGDETALARALENLLSNAAKYAPAGPIGVSVRRDGGDIVIEVADSGPGVPADQRAAVLEPGARLERDEAVPGTGLGLTIVRGVVERHLGSVEIGDREGGGALVTLRLPAA